MSLLLGFSGLLGICLERAPVHPGASGQDAVDDVSTVLGHGGDPQESGDPVLAPPSIEVQQRDNLLLASSGDDLVGWLSVGPRDNAECRSRIFQIPPSHPEYKNIRAGNTVRLTTRDIGYYYCFRAQDQANKLAFRSHLVEYYKIPPPQVDQREKASGSSLQTVGDMRHFSGRQFKDLLDSVKLPNLVNIADGPAITGNEQTDSRIRRVAEERGYRLQPVVADSDELETINEKLLQPDAARAYLALSEAAQHAGHPIILKSGYRGYDVQRHLLFRHLKTPYTEARINSALRVVAPPGYSRHQTGYAIDIATAEYGINEFKYSNAYAWLIADNFLQAKKHGFIPSYPAGVDNQGPDPEPWEFFYVGADKLVASP